jgi:hypothetical protein
MPRWSLPHPVMISESASVPANGRVRFRTVTRPLWDQMVAPSVAWFNGRVALGCKPRRVVGDMPSDLDKTAAVMVGAATKGERVPRPPSLVARALRLVMVAGPDRLGALAGRLSEDFRRVSAACTTGMNGWRPDLDHLTRNFAASEPARIATTARHSRRLRLARRTDHRWTSPAVAHKMEFVTATTATTD